MTNAAGGEVLRTSLCNYCIPRHFSFESVFLLTFIIQNNKFSIHYQVKLVKTYVSHHSLTRNRILVNMSTTHEQRMPALLNFNF